MDDCSSQWSAGLQLDTHVTVGGSIFGSAASGTPDAKADQVEASSSKKKVNMGLSPRGKMKPGGKAKAKAKVKSNVKAKEKPKKECPICVVITDDWMSGKTECRPCFQDKDAAYRDMKRQGELEFFNELKNDMALFRDFLTEWRQECGPPKGPGRTRGGFNTARFKERHGHRLSNIKAQDKVMKTKSEFADAMEAKGMTRQWAFDEWERRFADPKYDNDLDPDCKLPRTQMHGETFERAQEEMFKEAVVEIESKEVKNPKHSDVKRLIGEMGSEMSMDQKTSDALRRGDFTALTAATLEAIEADDERRDKTYSSREFLLRHEVEKKAAEERGEKRAAAEGIRTVEAIETSESEKKQLRYVNVESIVQTASDKASATFIEAQELLEACYNDIRDKMSQAEVKAAEEPSRYTLRLEQLKERFIFMEAMLGTNDEWDAYCTKVKDQSVPMPCEKAMFDSVIPLFRFKLTCEDVRTATDQEELTVKKQAVNNAKAWVKFAKTIADSAVTGFTGAMKAEAADDRAKEKKAQAAAKKEEKAGSQISAEPHGPKEPVTAVPFLKLDLTRLPNIIERKEQTNPDWEIPFVVRESKELADVAQQPPLKLNSIVFKSSFSRKGEHCEHQLTKLTKAAANREALMKFGPSLDARLLEDTCNSDLFLSCFSRGGGFVNLTPNCFSTIFGLISEKSRLDIACVPFRTIASYIADLKGAQQIEIGLADVQYRTVASVGEWPTPTYQ